MNLCIVTATFGQPSETFVKRHIDHLGHQPAFVIARSVFSNNLSHSSPERILFLDQFDSLIPLGGPKMLLKSLFLFRPSALLSTNQRNAVTKFLLRNEVDIVLMEFMDASLPLVRHIQELNISVVVHGHGSDVSSRLKHWWWRRAYGLYREVHVVVVSERSKRKLIESCKLKPEMVHVIPCSPDVSDLPQISRRKMIPKPGSIRAVSVGRLVCKKDPVGLVEVLNIAHNVFGLDITFTLVGGGPLYEEVRERISSYGLQERVFITGEISHDDVMTRLSTADIYLQNCRTDPMTGEEEGLPVSVLEAMSLGLPVISTIHAGIPEVIENNVTGFLVAEGDYYAMAVKLYELSGQSHYLEQIAKNGRDVIYRKFNWEIERQDLRKLFSAISPQDRL